MREIKGAIRPTLAAALVATALAGAGADSASARLATASLGGGLCYGEVTVDTGRAEAWTWARCMGQTPRKLALAVRTGGGWSFGPWEAWGPTSSATVWPFQTGVRRFAWDWTMKATACAFITAPSGAVVTGNCVSAGVYDAV